MAWARNGDRGSRVGMARELRKQPKSKANAAVVMDGEVHGGGVAGHPSKRC